MSAACTQQGMYGWIQLLTSNLCRCKPAERSFVWVGIHPPLKSCHRLCARTWRLSCAQMDRGPSMQRSWTQLSRCVLSVQHAAHLRSQLQRGRRAAAVHTCVHNLQLLPQLAGLLLPAPLQLLGLSVSRREVEAMLAEVDRDGSGANWAAHCAVFLPAFCLMTVARLARRSVSHSSHLPTCLAGEVEYAEFLEIMTIQLAKLAEQKEAAATGRAKTAASSGGKAPPAQGRAGSADGEDGSGDAAAGDASAAAAAVLPFDLVATAYRRKKLMGALAEDDK